MGDKSAIEWTDATWDPVTGCSKVSPGCAHCYAETVALRFWPKQYARVESESRKPIPVGVLVHPSEPRAFTDVLTHEDRLEQPLHWRRPRRVFVNSMSDLFHEDVPDEFIDKVFAVMGLAHQHTFQILTKRAERMRDYVLTLTGSVERMDDIVDEATDIAHDCIGATAWLQKLADRIGEPWPLPNVWLGVSVENQHFADERIPLLLQTPAAVRFISAEPLLETVNIEPFLWDEDDRHDALCGLDWVIVGGESGPGARPFDLAWARSIVAQCQAAGVPVFVKQLGERPVTVCPSCSGLGVADGQAEAYCGRCMGTHRQTYIPSSGKGGEPAEWPADLRIREFPKLHRQQLEHL